MGGRYSPQLNLTTFYHHTIMGRLRKERMTPGAYDKAIIKCVLHRSVLGSGEPPFMGRAIYEIIVRFPNKIKNRS